MAAPILSVEGLGRQVGDRWIWRGLNLVAHPGDRVGIAGASGTGKSLLLRAIAALDPVNEGRILFQAKPLTAWHIPTYRTQVAYLHQRPVLFEGTVESNLQGMFRLAARQHQTYNRDRILNYLEFLGRSPDFLTQPAAMLSGGEGQIVAFLRALQGAPQVLLLDEPTASLDADTAQSLEKLVERWHQEDPRRATFWTSHDTAQLQRVTHRTIAL